MLWLLTLLHFLVDGICGGALAVYASAEPMLAPIVYHFALYNAIAFGTQWLAGLVLDKRPRWLPGSLVLASTLLAAGTQAALGIGTQAVLLGLGNSLFHAAGGSVVLRGSSDFRQPGVFVCSGAVGLALGLNQLVGPLVFLAICVPAALLAAYRLRGGEAQAAGTFGMRDASGADALGTAFGASGASGVSASAWGGRPQRHVSFDRPAAPVALACLALLFGCIVLRGFGGGGGSSAYVMLFPCVFALGKALGGVVCDRLGYRRTILLILVLCAVALLLQGLASALLVTLAFNMTMPLTLRLAHWCCPDYPGLMFGLAAGCLLPGVFWKGFSLVPPAMAVLQFLGLAAAGWLLYLHTGRQELGGVHSRA